MIDTLRYKNISYPKFQEDGWAAQFVIPFAKKVCIGRGVDVGCNKKEWMLYPNDPDCMPIDPLINEYNALHFPMGCNKLDYIFSSHCLEHLDNWVDALDYWYDKLSYTGTLFLYLPDYSQQYWRPWNDRKHIHILSPQIISDYLMHKNYAKIYTSGIDLNNSFTVMAQK